jgi:putative NADPH-quinone reductase
VATTDLEEEIATLLKPELIVNHYPSYLIESLPALLRQAMVAASAT